MEKTAYTARRLHIRPYNETGTDGIEGLSRGDSISKPSVTLPDNTASAIRYVEHLSNESSHTDRANDETADVIPDICPQGYSAHSRRLAPIIGNPGGGGVRFVAFPAIPAAVHTSDIV